MRKNEQKQFIQVSKNSIKLSLFAYALLFAQTTLATDYNVGPSQPLTSLDSVPWLDLQAGDNVRIHYRTEPYRTKVALHGQGTKDAPIVIQGIKGPNGELPVISGENATTPENLHGFFSERWDENLAVFLIKRGSGDDYWNYKPSHITFENLKIVGGYSGHTFTDSNGNIRNYSDSAAGIWAVLVDGLIVRGCEITDNGNGLFVLSKDGEENVSRNILVEKNRIYGNGVSNSWLQHNIYTQAANITFQYNELGQTREGSKGSNLKDRSSGTVIRYNKIESGARVLDLVDPEDGGAVIASEPDFHDTYVYGNLILNDHKDAPHSASANMIHYGGDSGQTNLYRKGTLHFYNNSVYIHSDKADSWRVALFDLETDEETVEVKNNIIHHQGDSNFYIMRTHGIANIGETNWITSGWENGRPGIYGFKGTVNLSSNGFIESETPCLIDPENENFTLDNNSICVDAATDLSGEGITLDKMYKSIASYENRTVKGTGVDLGAFESEGTSSANLPPSIPANVISSAQTATSIFLNWSPAAGTVTGYKIYRDGYEIANQSGTSFVDNGLSASTNYSYTVSAYNHHGDSAQSEAISVSTTTADSSGGNEPDFGAISGIDNLLEVSPAPGSVNVNVSELKLTLGANYSNTQPWVLDKKIKLKRYSDNELIATFTAGSLPSTNGGSHTITIPLNIILDSNTKYYVEMDRSYVIVYAARAPWKLGAISGKDVWSFTTTHSGAAETPPSVPTGFASTSISFSWAASTGSVTGYKVYRNGEAIANVSDTTFTDYGLTSATSYSYTISALNGNSESEQSAPYSVIIP